MLSQPPRTPNTPLHKRSLQQWALTATVLAVLSLSPISGWSLTLGNMRVQSALGEPLRAQLSLGELTPEELGSIQVNFASPAVYQAAGIQSNPALSGVQIRLDAAVPSNVLVNLSSTDPISEPFVDMLLEIQWASGKVVREYTLLLNPPTPAASPVSTEQVLPTAPSVTDPGVGLPVIPELATTAVGAVVNATPESSETSATAPAQALATALRLRVIRGDTAAALAMAHLPAGVSLDQMLQAMLRANPSAFVDNNVNRLKAGAELMVPTAQEAQSIDRVQARRLVVAQSKDFNAYRRSLASNAPRPNAGPAGQVASGQIETQVQDKAQAAPTADQLTLSKGAVATGASAEAQIAATKQAQDEETQQADLKRNINDLKALSESTPSTGVSGATDSNNTGGPTVSGAPSTPLPPEPTDETSARVIDQLMSQPWTLPTALGLLAVLMGLAISRMSRRKRQAPTTLSSAPTANDEATGINNGLNFNLANINLDLTPPESPVESDGVNAEALFTKFELAREFLSLGDRVAAKALAEEVHADATGQLKHRAELFLSELG